MAENVLVMAENEKLKREIESLKYTSETLKLKLAEIAQRDICGTERWTERM